MDKEQFANLGKEYEQQQEPRSHRVKQLHLRQLLHKIDRIQRFDQPKGMIINGSKGVSKTIGVESFLSTQKDA